MLITVDTGGTKTLVAGFLDDGTINKKIKFPTPKQEIIYVQQLVETIHAITDELSVRAISVAIPGKIKNNIIVSCPHLGWQNFDIITALRKHFPTTPILIENDANLGGLGETRLLNIVPESSLYVTISTGIGTGIITDGRINHGMRHSEGGHSLVEFDGVVREWESFASGEAIFKAYGKLGKDIHSKRTWNQIADRISRGFLALIPVIQPDVVIIGGSMGTHFMKYDDQLMGLLRERLPKNIVDCPKFIHAVHPEEAVIYGCYYYALDSLADTKT